MSRSRNFAAACFLSAFVSGGCHKQPIAATPPTAITPAPNSANPDSRPSERAASDQPKPKPSEPPLIPKGPLGDVDKSFLDAYEARRTSVLAHQKPYVVVSGSRLILHVPDQTIPPVVVIPDSYHALKDIAHLPFALYLLLSPVETGIVDLKSQTDALDMLFNRIENAKTEINSKWFSTDEIERQHQILDQSAALIRQVLQAQTVSHDSLRDFAKRMGPLMLANAWDAGCAQIKATHNQMMIWKESLSSEDWQQLIAVNRARHQARYRNAATQYFSWLFGDKGTSWSYPGESMKVIFVEALGPGEDASDELATVVIDADASQAFFADPWRLTEDILSNGAAACIEKLPPASRYKN